MIIRTAEELTFKTYSDAAFWCNVLYCTECLANTWNNKHFILLLAFWGILHNGCHIHIYNILFSALYRNQFRRVLSRVANETVWEQMWHVQWTRDLLELCDLLNIDFTLQFAFCANKSVGYLLGETLSATFDILSLCDSCVIFQTVASNCSIYNSF